MLDCATKLGAVLIEKMSISSVPRGYQCSSWIEREFLDQDQKKLSFAESVLIIICADSSQVG